jgi:hypothetical protein
MTGRLDEVMKYIELNKTSINNDDIDKTLIKKIDQPSPYENRSINQINNYENKGNKIKMEK